MVNEKKQLNKGKTSGYKGKKNPSRDNKKRFFKKKGAQKKNEYDQRMVDIARVTRVVKGGRRFSFRALVVVGNRKGKVGIGLAKGADVSLAIEKAVKKAKKNLINVDIKKITIPHEVNHKYKAVKLLVKPAREGKGLIAGSSVRTICELAGIKNISVKILGTRNRINNSIAMIEALKGLYPDLNKAN